MNTPFNLDTELFRSILSENKKVLADIATGGVDLTKKVEIEFVCEFPNKDKAIQARTEMRKLGGLPDEGLYMIADHSVNAGHCNLLICVPMVPEPNAISELEARLTHVAEVCDGDVSGWEFADANN